MQLDVDSGSVRRVVDLPPCGANSVTQLSEQILVSALACSYQLARTDLESGTTDVLEGYSTSSYLSERDGAA